jgi:hypothetical protein
MTFATQDCAFSFFNANTVYINLHCVWHYTAKTKCRKFETNLPRKGYRGLSPNFHIHVSVSELYLHFHDGSAFLLEEICKPILGIYKSLTDT